MAEIDTTAPRFEVAISSTAANMMSSLYGSGSAEIEAAIADIKSDIEDPRNVKRIVGYENAFVARGHGLRVIFSREGDTLLVTAVSAES